MPKNQCPSKLSCVAAENTSKCAICSEFISDGAFCQACNNLLHFHCGGVTESGYRKLGDRRQVWRCIRCKQTSQPVTPVASPACSPSMQPSSSINIALDIAAIKASLAPLATLAEDIKAMRRDMSTLQATVNDNSTALSSLSSRLNAMEKRLVEAESRGELVFSLQNRVDKLELEARERDQFTRANNIEIRGIPESRNENLMDLVCSLGSKITYPISKGQINFITRTPTRNTNTDKPIIVAFVNRYVKEDFVAAAKKRMKESGLTPSLIGLKGHNKIFVNDHLSPSNKILLAKAKMTARERGFQHIWVKHTKILVRKNDTSPVIVVKSENDLAKLSGSPIE